MRFFALTACCLLVSLPAWAAPKTPNPATPKTETVTVVMVDDRFEPDHVIFHAGRPTALHLVNQGKDMHEFTAPEFLHASKIRTPHALSNNGGDIVVQPGQTVVVKLVPGHAGDYKLICADHDWDGMVGSITVQP
ncbi:MAG TPA: cupredoxin domain-containing protein [Rhodopila sp.]|nr:cupredoxin domain-containing protein [Rhodopila sp.]